MEEQAAMIGIKNNFLTQTGRHVKIVECSRWESLANFTFEMTADQAVKMIKDATDWTWEDLFHRESTRLVRKRDIVFRRGVLDSIATSNGVTMVEIARFTDRRDHVSIIQSLQYIERTLDTQPVERKYFMEVVAFCRDNYPLYRGKTFPKEQLIEGTEETIINL